MGTLDHTDYSLANLAGVSMPDNHDSPGAKFLLGVQDAVNAAKEEHAPYGYDMVSDLCHGIADNAVPIYTYEKWQTFVDLAAWQEDLDEYASGDSLDLDDASNLALYVIARRLAELLFEEVADDNTDEAEETEDILADEETMTAITEGLAELNEEDAS